MTRVPLLTAALVVSLSVFADAQCNTLTVSFAAGNGQSGNMFDLIDLGASGLDIIGVDVNNLAAAATATTVNVYYKTGSHVGFEAAPAAWTLHAAVNVTLSPTGTGTPISFATPISIPPGGAPFALYVTCIAGANLAYTNGIAVGSQWAADANLRVNEGVGIAFPFAGTFSPRNFNGRIRYTTPGSLSAWQTNTPALSIDFDGAQASAQCGGGIVTKNVVFGQTATATFNLSSTLVGAGSAYDIAINNVDLQPNFFNLASGTVNLDFISAFPSFLNGGGAPLLSLIPGSGIPGASQTNLSIALTNVPAGKISMQGFAVNIAAPGGVSLSQGAELDVVSTAAPTSVPGPVGDDTSTAVDLATLTWCPAGVPFYGTSYTVMFVASNGRVNFGLANDDFSPTLAEALTGQPFAGNWSDLAPNTGGTITINNPGAGLVNVNYNLVRYFGDTATASFDIDFDCATGGVSIGNLQGILPSTLAMDQILGVSPGGAALATDPGLAGFGPGLAGAAGNSTDMLYAFNTAVSASLRHAAITAGMLSVSFTPDGFGNYIWLGL